MTRLLPAELETAFVREIEKGHDPERTKKLWNAAKKLINEVSLPYYDWARLKYSIYSYFEKKSLSPDYAKKIIRVLNLWGEFCFAKGGKPHAHVKCPTGYAAGRIMRAYRNNRTTDKASDGLTIELLAALKGNLSGVQYRWLFISLWFGLRPQEVENLRVGKFHRFEEVEGKLVLCVQQTKLVNLPEEDQWKYIPILYPEQMEAVGYIREGYLKKPHPKVLKRYTGGNHHTYAGRKGFTVLMWERGHDFVDVSDWLGHKSVETTFKSYMKWKKLKVRRIA